MIPCFQHRNRLMRWLRRWLYRLVSEQAAIAGEIALWVPTYPCARCGQAIMSGSAFCARCGTDQRATGPHVAVVESPTTGPHTFTVTGIMRAYRKDGKMPAKAYIDSKKRGGE